MGLLAERYENTFLLSNTVDRDAQGESEIPEKPDDEKGAKFIFRPK